MKRIFALVLPIWLAADPSFAASKIFYGSRAGMVVTVVSEEGLDTAHAVIKTKHTREDATQFCAEYVGKVTSRCIQDELAVPLNDRITANCLTGEFVNFYGDRYRFEGPDRGNRGFAKYVLRDLKTGEVADGSSASGYPTNMPIFRALCPTKAPSDE
jgi:hypothetical protein